MRQMDIFKHKTVNKKLPLPILSAFAKLRKAATSIVSVRPSVRPHGKTRFPLQEFS